MKTERNIAPHISLPEELILDDPTIFELSNGLKVHHIDASHIDVLKIELVFKAGIWQQEKPLQALFSSRLLKEGTKDYTSQQIAEMLDYYGAYLQCQHSHHFTSVLLYVLSKHLNKLMPLFESIVKEPTFDEEELKISLNNKRQEYLVESEKVQTLAMREFNKAIYGDQHPYANQIQISDFDNISIDDLKSFHQQYMHEGNCHVFVTGKMDEGVRTLIDDAFGKNWRTGDAVVEQGLNPSTSAEKINFKVKENAIQCALRLGREGLLKTDENYHDLSILVTILGGYFGSRLMKNIREEKGYTYGIGSNMAANKYHSLLTIQSEMASENALPVLHEIFKEFKDLRENLISDEELDMVRTYLLGELARSYDGPFARAESHLMLWLYQLENKHINNYVHRITSITPEQIKSLACFYLNEKDWTIVAAGNSDLKNEFQKFDLGKA